MRRILSITLVLLIAFSMSVYVFAAEDDKSIDVYAKYEDSTEGIYKADVASGSATINADSMSISVSGIPNTTKRIEVFPIPASESEALDWMGGKVSEHGTLSHAYIISLVDASGNKTSANGVSVTISCSHCNAYIFAETDGVPHNTVTPIARMNGNVYVCDLVLRNNLTTEERPLDDYVDKNSFCERFDQMDDG